MLQLSNADVHLHTMRMVVGSERGVETDVWAGTGTGGWTTRLGALIAFYQRPPY